MKNILLTSTALVAFAGAAAAGGHTSVSFGGEASAEYNSVTGYATAAEMTASASATLDNGLTASTSFTLETTNFGSGEFGAGSVSLSSDTASLTFGTAVVGGVFAATGDKYAIGSGGYDDGEVAGIAASATFGAVTLVLSGEINAITAVTAVTAVTEVLGDDPDTGAVETDFVLVAGVTGVTGVTGVDSDTTVDNIEIGVTTSTAGWDLGFGLDLSTSEYAVTAAGTAGGATVGFGMSSTNDWDVSVAYPVGTVTVSASTDEANAWEVGAAYAADGVSAGIVLSPGNAWELTAGYAADGITVAAAFTDASVMTLGATYDMGNGLTVGAGIEDTENYAFASYDLGGGANAFVDYTDAAADLEEVGPSERDIAVGTTVGVSFTF